MATDSNFWRIAQEVPYRRQPLGQNNQLIGYDDMPAMFGEDRPHLIGESLGQDEMIAEVKMETHH